MNSLNGQFQEEGDIQLDDSFNIWLQFLKTQSEFRWMDGCMDGRMDTHTHIFLSQYANLFTITWNALSVHNIATESGISMTIAFNVLIIYCLRLEDFIEV